MLELGVGADLVRGVGAILWGLLAIALLVALIKPKSIKVKALCTLMVLGIFFGPMVPGALRAHEHQQRYAKAKALFDERCKTAGEKIYRTVEGVDGVFLMNIRPQVDNFADQFALTDPYGHDFGGDTYIASFLWGRDNKGETWEGDTRGGFGYVEAIDATTQVRHRYSATVRHLNNPGNAVEFLVSKNPTVNDSPRYGVMWADLSTPEDRKLWIAGGSIKIIDLKTNEVMGERKGYMMDAGQGNVSGGRSPWLYAQQNACPEFPTIGGADARRRRSSQINRNFVESILKLKQGA